MRRNTLLLVLLVSLAGAAIQSTVIELQDTFRLQEIEVQNKKHFRLSLSKESAEEVNSESKSIYLVVHGVKGIANCVLSGVDQETQGFHTRPQRAFQSKQEGAKVIIISKKSPEWEDISASKSVYVTCSAKASNEPAKLTLTTACSGSLHVSMNNSYELDVQSLDSLKVVTKVSHSDNNHHYKFFFEGLRYNKGDEMSGWGALGETDITVSKKGFEFLRFDRNKLGYVMDPTDASYCSVGSCSYTLVVKLHAVESLRLYLGEHLQIEDMSRSDSTIGYIKEASVKENFFKFPIKEPNTVVFTFVPIEGNGQLLVNPGFMPKDEKEFFYRSQSSAGQRVIVSKEELQKMNIKDSNLFAKVVCLHACRYILRVKLYQEDVFEIHTGFTENGIIHGAETRNHLLAFQNTKGDVHNLNVKLQIHSGEANLYVKLCLPNAECQAVKEELTNPLSPLLRNKEPKSIKELRLPVICSELDSFVKKEYLLSKTCSFMIVVEGVSKDPNSKISYDLSIEDNDSQHVVLANQFNFVSLNEGESKYFLFGYNHPKTTASGLDFVFDAKYGNFKICIQKGTNFHTAVCDREETVDSDYHGLSSSYKRLSFAPLNGLSVAGTYLVKVTATQRSGFNFGVVENDEESLSGSFIARELRAGNGLTDQLRNKNAVNYYSFKLNMAEGVKAILITLNPIRGTFAFAVRNDDQKPSRDQTFWTSATNNMMIKSEDPMFKNNATYFIAAYAFDFFENSELRYSIKVTYTDKHNLLTPGIPDHGLLLNDRQCFVIEMQNNYETLMVLKGYENRGQDLYADIGSSGMSNVVPSAESHMKRALGQDIGFEITKEEITKHCEIQRSRGWMCHVYVCLYGKANEQFTVSYTYNDLPFVLQGVKSIAGPLIVNPLKEIKFLFHAPRDTPTDIEEFGTLWSVSIFANIFEEGSKDAKYPTASAYQKGNHYNQSNNLIHFTRDEVNKFTKPLILITVAKSSNFEFHSPSNYFFNGHFVLEAGYNFKELVKHNSRTVELARSEVVYFYFYNNEPHSTIAVLMDSLDGGDADVFITKGRETRPTKTQFLARSYGYRSGQALITAEMLKGKGFKDMKGVYTVGVFANTDCKVLLHWRHTNSRLFYGIVNRQSETLIPKSGFSFIQFMNFWDKEIQLVVKTGHNNLRVMMSIVSPQTVYRETDFELFPRTEANSVFNYEVKPEQDLVLIKVPKNTPGFCIYCRYLFTFENLSKTGDVKVQYKFQSEAPYAAEYLSTSSPSMGVLEAQHYQKFRMDYRESDIKEKTLVEIHLIQGQASLQIAGSIDMAKPIKEQALSVGYHRVPLDDIKLNHGVTNGYRGFFGQFMMNLYFKLNCETNCSYKLVLVKPNALNSIAVNTPREAYVLDHVTESFLYESSGKEPHISIKLILTSIMNEPNLLADSDLKLLKDRIQVFHTKNKADLVGSLNLKTALKPTLFRVSTVDRKVHLQFSPVKGFFVIQIKGFETVGFKYRLEVNTSNVMTLTPGRLVISEIEQKSKEYLYEFYAHQPGEVFVNVKQCFGNINLLTKAADGSYQKMQSLALGKFNQIAEVTQAQPVYFKVEKADFNAIVDNRFGYLDDKNKEAVFGVEVYSKHSFDLIPLDSFKPFDQDIFVNLRGSTPKIGFRPVVPPVSTYFTFSISYKVVLSRDPALVKYYQNCDTMYLSKVVKKRFKNKIKDIIQIIDLGKNPDYDIDITKSSMAPIITKELKIKSGRKYFMSILATVDIMPTSEFRSSLQAPESVRIVYPVVEFEYRSFWYPIEYLTASLGLLAILVVSFCIVNKKIIGFVKQKLGFQQVNSEIDKDLEEYFMKIKHDFDSEEKKRTEGPTNPASRREVRPIVPPPEKILETDPREVELV